MNIRRLVVLASMMLAALGWTSEAPACGAFAAPPSEGKLAASLPFLTVEQVLILWDTGLETAPKLAGSLSLSVDVSVTGEVNGAMVHREQRNVGVGRDLP